MRQREASTGPLLRTLYVSRGPVEEGPPCQSVAGQLVEENTQVSLVESFGEYRLIECMGERESRF